MNAIRFLMNHGHVVEAGMSQSEIESIIKRWGSESRIPNRFLAGTCTLTRQLWAVDLNEVVGIKSMYYELQPSTQQGFPVQDNSGFVRR